MKKNLEEVLTKMDMDYGGLMSDDSRHYMEVNIGRYAEKMGYTDVKQAYDEVNALILLRKPVKGMKVRIDGRTFIDYASFDSGLVVPGFVARKTRWHHRPFVPKDSMILNFN
ncbi:MAG: hypothetical protein HKM93_04985 [Desulfobacteraceae bacterium]|nr:hypothetical protein [Desulfobacteraceae bacterium]